MFAENHGKLKVLNVFILIVQKREVKVNVVYVTKVRKHEKKEVHQKKTVSKAVKISYSVKRKKELKALETVGELESKVQRVRLQECSCKRDFKHDE